MRACVRVRVVNFHFNASVLNSCFRYNAPISGSTLEHCVLELLLLLRKTNYDKKKSVSDIE